METEKQLAFDWPKLMKRASGIEKPRNPVRTSRRPAKPSEYLGDEALREVKRKQGGEDYHQSPLPGPKTHLGE